MNWRFITGIGTTVCILGFTIYAVKQYRDKQKAEEESISVEQAMAEYDAYRRENNKHDNPIVAHNKKIEDDYEEGRGIFNPECKWVSSESGVDNNGEVLADENDEYEQEDEEYTNNEDEGFKYDGVDFEKPLAETLTEEDRKLRHEPNSVDAMNQYIRMELAEWMPLEDTYQTMLKLFDFPFKPMNDGDHDLLTNIIDYRVQFFGFNSRWVQNITFADVILHYARLADYNCGEGVRYWVEYILDFNEFDSRTPSHTVDLLLNRLNSHTYFNQDRQTFGLFGLTRQSMDQAIKIANLNIDKTITYEIEFNEFLKTCL